MDKIKAQEVIDELIPRIRKELIDDVRSSMTKIEGLSEATKNDLACVLESVADAAFKASADLLVEVINKIE
jgi:hypothetical protein